MLTMYRGKRIQRLGKLFRIEGSIEKRRQVWSRRAISVVFVPLCMALASLFSSCGGAARVNPHSVVLTWDASISTDVVAYNVYRSDVSGGPYSLLNASIPAHTLTCTDWTVQAGRTYFYVVTAVNSGGGESAYSKEASAYVPSP
jgi:hypothetical protein